MAENTTTIVETRTERIERILGKFKEDGRFQQLERYQPKHSKLRSLEKIYNVPLVDPDTSDPYTVDAVDLTDKQVEENWPSLYWLFDDTQAEDQDEKKK